MTIFSRIFFSQLLENPILAYVSLFFFFLSKDGFCSEVKLFLRTPRRICLGRLPIFISTHLHLHLYVCIYTHTYTYTQVYISLPPCTLKLLFISHLSSHLCSVFYGLKTKGAVCQGGLQKTHSLCTGSIHRFLGSISRTKCSIQDMHVAMLCNLSWRIC